MTQCGHTLESMMMVEYAYDNPCRYDGVSEYWCKPCDRRWGRWTGKELKGTEHEPPDGLKHRKDCPMNI